MGTLMAVTADIDVSFDDDRSVDGNTANIPKTHITKHRHREGH